jgi:hypothetical protein
MLNVLTERQVEDSISRPIGSGTEIKRMEAWLEDHIERGRKKIFSVVVTLTPVLASLLLARNPINRPFSKRNIEALKVDIANGNFATNGESIIISDTGMLNNGQHRCKVVVETGLSIETVMVFGPTEASRYTIDTGRMKTAANMLAMRGRKYSSVLSSVANYLFQWKQHGTLATAGAKRGTTQQIQDAAQKYKGVDDSIEFTALSNKTVGSHAVLAFCHYAFWKASSRENADFFMTKLMEGDGLKKGDPILYCRNRLLGIARKDHALARSILVFKCWNAHRAGLSITSYVATNGTTLPKLEC